VNRNPAFTFSGIALHVRNKEIARVVKRQTKKGNEPGRKVTAVPIWCEFHDVAGLGIRNKQVPEESNAMPLGVSYPNLTLLAGALAVKSPAMASNASNLFICLSLPGLRFRFY
jgi:hypothetical protein